VEQKRDKFTSRIESRILPQVIKSKQIE